ncbi:MAG: hypothetical protein P8I03_15540 [Thalassotalea sp.]|nr:hypothetical protein [Thalassotalea sp.]
MVDQVSDQFGMGEDAFLLELYNFSESIYKEFERLFALNYRYDNGVPYYDIPEKMAELFWSKTLLDEPMSNIPLIETVEVRKLLTDIMVLQRENEISTPIYMNILDTQYRVLEVSISHIKDTCIAQLERTKSSKVSKVENGYLINFKEKDNIKELPVSDIVKTFIEDANLAGFKAIIFNDDGYVFNHLSKYEH